MSTRSISRLARWPMNAAGQLGDCERALLISRLSDDDMKRLADLVERLEREQTAEVEPEAVPE